MEYITLNEDGFADVSGWISCYVADYSGEYIGQRDEYISATTGLPAGAYLDQPPEKAEGKAIVRGENGWTVITDNRGKKMHSCESGTASVIDYLGDVREGYTLDAPSTQYDKWDGSKWVTDIAVQRAASIAAAESEKSRLYSMARDKINPLQDAVDLDIATAEEISLLKEWKTYGVLLNRVDTSSASSETPIAWPEIPSN